MHVWLLREWQQTIIESTTLLVSRENVCIVLWKQTAVTLNICCDTFTYADANAY